MILLCEHEVGFLFVFFGGGGDGEGGESDNLEKKKEQKI